MVVVCTVYGVQMEPLLSGTGSFGMGDLLEDAVTAGHSLPSNYIPYSYSMQKEDAKRPRPPGGEGSSIMSPRKLRVNKVKAEGAGTCQHATIALAPTLARTSAHAHMCNM